MVSSVVPLSSPRTDPTSTFLVKPDSPPGHGPTEPRRRRGSGSTLRQTTRLKVAASALVMIQEMRCYSITLSARSTALESKFSFPPKHRLWGNLPPLSEHAARDSVQRTHYPVTRGRDITRGRIICILVPSSGEVSSTIRPPKLFVTRLWTICKPRPALPASRRVVKKGSNAWRLISGLMPQPSSEKIISTLSSSNSRALISIVPGRPSENA